ncbi:hypothetical protein KBB25_02220, partial [Candidatus Gracilibacteria bacterium]|nr:hypothetical protein [Candidatus Gracilibacteria bacterium]
MRNITRVFLSIFAFFGVSALGYYAYAISFGTISFAFLGTEHQQQNPLQLVIAKSSFFVKSNPKTLDIDALKSALLFGNVPLTSHPSVSGEYKVTVSGEVASVFMNLKKGEKITLSADIYNKNKKSSPRLSKDIIFTGPEYPQSLTLIRIGDPKYGKYKVQMYGFPSFNPEDVRYYGMYDGSKNCNIQDSWESMIPIKFHPISPIRKIGQISEMDIVLDFEKTESRICIIGGIGGMTTIVEDRALQPFSISSSTLQVLSPELDMKSQIEFRFSESIYSDTGTLYSHEYITNRQQAKIEFLKHLILSPDIPLLPENLILSPDRAIITLPLEDGKKYSISLRDIQDIYGRKESAIHEITAKKEPFLSLRFDADRNIYQKGEKIPAKLYALATPKNTYTLKLCQIGLDSYARLERIQGESDKKYTDAIYDILNSPKDASGCIKRDIALSSTGYVSQFDPQELLTQGSLKSGLYMLTFANKSDLESFPRLVKPLIFSVVDTHITMKVDASGKIIVLATDLATGKPLPDQQITAMRNITRTYVDKYDPNTQTSSKEYLPLSSQNFATGIILGKTNSEGFLDLQLDTFKGLNGYDDSPYGLSFESWWEYEGRYDSFLVRSDSSDRMGLVVSTWNDGITGYNFGMKDSDYSYQTRAKYTSFLHTDRRLYL